MVVGANIDKVYMVMDFGGMDLKVGVTAVEITGTLTTALLRLSYCIKAVTATLFISRDTTGISGTRHSHHLFLIASVITSYRSFLAIKIMLC